MSNKKKSIVFKLPDPTDNKDTIECAKLYLECTQLHQNSRKNIWWFLRGIAAAIPVVILCTTLVILYFQNKNEKQRMEVEIARQFASTIQGLDAESSSSRLGSVLALENFMEKDKKYRIQIFVLLSAKLKEEAASKAGSAHKDILVNQILNTFRKVSTLRLNARDKSIELFLESSEFDSLDIRNTDLRGANLKGSKLRGAILRNCRLDYARLTEAQLNGADLNNSILRNAFLINSILQKATLIEADLTGANLVGAILDSARLDRATLTQAQLQKTTLRGANLHQANFEGASLKKANLNGANLSFTSLRNTDLNGTNLCDVVGLTPDSLILSKNWKMAILDDDIRKNTEKL